MNAIKGKGRKEQRKSASDVLRGSQSQREREREYRSIPWRVAYFFMAKTTPGIAARERRMCLRRNDTGGGERDAGVPSRSVLWPISAHAHIKTIKRRGSRMHTTIEQKAIPIYFTAPN